MESMNAPLKWLLRSVLRLLFRVSVHGAAGDFAYARTLIVANHASFIDGVLLAVYLPVDATFVVHTQVAQEPFFRWALRFIPHVMVDAANPFVMKAVVRLVEAGTPVVIFPEGRLTLTGSLMKIYDGAGFVAARTGATIVPVHIQGTARSFFGRLAGVYPRELLPRVRIVVRPRRTIPMPALPSAKRRRRRAGDLMRKILLDMLVEARPERTLFRAFLDARATFGAHHALVEDVRLKEETYGSLLRMAIALSRVLRRMSVEGEMIGVLTPNAAPTLGLILALSAVKRVPAILNYTAGAEGLRSACTAARVRLIVASRALVDKARLAPALAELVGVRILYLEDAAASLRTSDKACVLWQRFFPTLACVPQSPADPAVVLFTSGTEGKPKGVVHSHASILANVAQIWNIGDFTPLDKLMLAMPVFHSFGFTCGAILPLVTGCKVFLYPNPLHFRIIPELVYDRNCTVLVGTSTFLGRYGQFAHPYDFTRLRYVVAGAERLSEEVRSLWIDKFGIRVLEGYGVTECAPVIAANVPMACRSGSVGQIVPCLDYRLEPVAGIAGGGILHVKGPNVMMGYLRHSNPGVLDTGSIVEGWYDTGDIVRTDEDDFLYIRGRAKRFAKIAGEMVSLELVEQIAARAAPGFSHAACARPDGARGEIIVLFTTSTRLRRDQLTAAAKALGATELAVPRILAPLPAIPRLGSGKPDYVRLQSMAEAPAP